MHLSVYLPLLFSAIFGFAAPVLARRLPPHVGTWLLGAGGLLAAAGSAASLALLGFTLVGQSPILAENGRWSDATLRQADPVATPIAVVALVMLVALAARFLLAVRRRMIALLAAYRLAASMPAPGGELVVIDHPDKHAYAIPGRPGRIVVFTGLLRNLDADERRAVLAHERAHLTGRHHLHHTIAHVAAAANPLLHRLPAAVALSTERWADESAAAVCRRDVVADALARTANARPSATPTLVLAAATTEVASRLRALRAPAPRLGVWRVAVLVSLLVATAAAVLLAAHDTEHLFEAAQRAYRTGHP